MSCDGSRQEIVRPGLAVPSRLVVEATRRVDYFWGAAGYVGVSRRAGGVFKRECSVLCGYCASFVGGRSSITGYPEGRVRSVIGARLRNSTGWSRKTGRRNGSKGRGRGPSASSAAWGGARSLRTPRRWPGPIPLVNSCVHDQIPRQVRRPHTRAVSINVIPAGDVSRTTGLRSTGPLQLDGPWVGPALQNGAGVLVSNQAGTYLLCLRPV